ncbi:hypothetical protein GUITHDRAFT_120703 [Guillardia theta CCMP2712]|uniref:Uncharacterized protein n=2 Tax=Guillardia theta TaxID=55529 RepID=L1IBB5_GUITC|nr:hypothetical protein GUITHDRAFT_120703 [Guillardia theta CCMP2712]EKX33135.1 hypothetical protein GUITHDRAFT_120703 [Guillardia theta CCMP2712]|eukprot:XP_005820115.1 hypothetical protein GUITHDRAFT_120703 [Guillardia theta CCMP2712]
MPPRYLTSMMKTGRIKRVKALTRQWISSNGTHPSPDDFLNLLKLASPSRIPLVQEVIWIYESSESLEVEDGERMLVEAVLLYLLHVEGLQDILRSVDKHLRPPRRLGVTAETLKAILQDITEEPVSDEAVEAAHGMYREQQQEEPSAPDPPALARAVSATLYLRYRKEIWSSRYSREATAFRRGQLYVEGWLARMRGFVKKSLRQQKPKSKFLLQASSSVRQQSTEKYGVTGIWAGRQPMEVRGPEGEAIVLCDCGCGVSAPAASFYWRLTRCPRDGPSQEFLDSFQLSEIESGHRFLVRQYQPSALIRT